MNSSSEMMHDYIDHDAEWQSDAESEVAMERIEQIERLVRIYEAPLLDALEREYGTDRGWMVCGPASVILANLVAMDTGIPLLPFCKDGKTEHLKLEMFMFNAFEDSGWPDRVDHTNMQYHTGKGFSMTVDPVSQLLWGGARKESGAIRIEKHCDPYLRDDLQTLHNLRTMSNLSIVYAMQGEWPDVWGVDGKSPSYQDHIDMLKIMHSPTVFDDVVETSVGEIIEVGTFWGQRLCRVLEEIREQVPRETFPLFR